MSTTLAPDRRARSRRAPERKQFITVPFELKEINAEKRQFEGYSAAWSEDLGDDEIVRGAFAKTIGFFKAGQKAITLIDSHQYGSVLNAYGDLVDATEDDKGLWSKWELIPGDDGQRILDRLKGRAVRKMSIGYIPVRYEFVTKAERRVRRLLEINWEETSLVLFPMNPDAAIDLDSVKALLRASKESDPEKRRQLMAELEEARDQLDAMLEEYATDDPSASQAPKGLAPDDPKRLATEAAIRDIHIRSLASPS